MRSNEKRVVKITVEFKTDACGKTYTNLAAATGDNGSASGRSPEIEVFRLVRLVHRC